LWGFIILAICCYNLPWVINPGASLTLNGYDLAEWSSLYPGIRVSSIPLLATFVLRSPLLWISVIIAIAPRPLVWLRIILILAIAGVLLPPPEFFTSSLDDPNYRQMLALSIAAFITGILGVVHRGQRGRIAIQIVATALILMTSLSGLVTGISLMREFNLPAHIGPGGVGLIFLSVVFGTELFIKRGNSHQVTS
jgi:hypothetical protein